MKKKLLLLAGAGPHTKVVEAAKEMGIYTIVADYLKDSPAKQIADETLINNIFDIDELVQYGKENKIDGVLGFCIDPTQKPAQQIAKRLNLPVFGDDDQVEKLTNKVAFKKFCKENNVDVIDEYTIEDVKNNNVQYPILIKPTDSRGSRGASICYDASNVLEAIDIAKKESSNGGVIIEKYLNNNQDLTISYLVKDGEPTLVSLGDRYSGREEDNLNRQLICTIQPSRYTKMYMEKVDNRVVNMIKNLGIKNGPVFMQGFVDGETVRMYDPGIRFPGNEYERIHAKATGLNLMKSIIPYCVGGEINDYNGEVKGSYNLNGKCAVQYMINLCAGTIAQFDGLDEIAKNPNVIDIQQRHFVGEKIENTGDIKHRAGEISILIDRDKTKIKEILEFIQSKLKVVSTDGKNMIISPFTPDYIEKFY